MALLLDIFGKIGLIDAARTLMAAEEENKILQQQVAWQREAHGLADMVQNGADGLALSALFAYNIIPRCFEKSHKLRPTGLH